MALLGTTVPNYDITKLYKPDDKQNYLVSQQHFGRDLAEHFTSSSSLSEEKPSPDQAVVLMKNHGFTAVGANIPQAIFRAVYTQVNARVQTKAIMLRNAFFGNVTTGEEGSEDAGKELNYISEDQVGACSDMADATQDRPWGLWVREVESCPLYVNSV